MTKNIIETIPGVGPATAQKLADMGVTSLEALAIYPSKTIADTAGIDESRARQLSRMARELLKMTDFITAQELYEDRIRIQKISTGCKALDNLLGGGIETRATTELAGEFRTGKTQLCHQLAVTVQLSKDGGGSGENALYIDSEGSFRPERIVQISKSVGLDPQIVLDNIIYARAYNTDHQMLLVDKAYEMVTDERVRLVVVDSLMSHFRSEYPGRENLAARQQKLNLHIHQLIRTAEIFNIAVVLTNQVIAQPDVFFGNSQKPAGGNIVAHSSTYRIWLKKGRDDKRLARIIDSPMHPESEAIFRITENGIEDA